MYAAVSRFEGDAPHLEASPPPPLERAEGVARLVFGADGGGSRLVRLFQQG
jgi:hypothetical protein